jgi:excisionase family DNA binding protein
MAGQLYTTAEAAEILKVSESWLKTKATARAIPCTFIGKHLRFSDRDISEIISSGARPALRIRSASQEGR